MLLDIVGGEPGPITEAMVCCLNATVRLRFASIKKYLGVNIRPQEAADILSRLGFAITAEDDESLKVEVPSYRFDVSIEADLMRSWREFSGMTIFRKRPASALSASRKVQRLPSE